MYTDFEKNLIRILMEAGYERIELPADDTNSHQTSGLSVGQNTPRYGAELPSENPVFEWNWYKSWSRIPCFLGKLAGSVAYYYAVYGTSAGDLANYTAQKSLVDQVVGLNSQRLGIRHSVVFNIFAGDLSGDVREIEKMIDAQGEFAMLPKYDIYYGVDTANPRIMRNSKQPDNMDGSLKKIQQALEGSGRKGWDHIATPPSRYAVPVAKYPILCYIIIGINVLMFLLMEIIGNGSTDTLTLIRFGAVSHHLVFTFGQYYRLLTSAFIHIGFTHLLLNMSFLIILGTRTERYFGHVKFAVIYLVSGVFGSLLPALFGSEFWVSAGASGALFGAMGALLAFMVLRKKQVENLRVGSLGTLVVVNVLAGFAINQMPGGPNVGNLAHISGLAVGLGLGYLLAGRD